MNKILAVHVCDIFSEHGGGKEKKRVRSNTEKTKMNFATNSSEEEGKGGGRRGGGERNI